MPIIRDIIEFTFSFALIINALLFIPQAIQLIRKKTAEGISLTTFLGFVLIQIAIVLHGAINRDYRLAAGYLFSIVTCGIVVVLLIYYKKHPSLQIAKTEEPFEQAEILETIIALLPGHVYWVDKQGRYLGCNDRQAVSAGLSSRKEIIGKRNKDLPWNFNTQFLPAKLDSINQEVMTTGKEIVLEEPALLRDGTEAVFLSSKVPLRHHSGEIVGMVGISIDITARKQAEQKLQETQYKLEGMTLVGANIAHELRTPLASINAGIASIKEVFPHLIHAYQLAEQAGLPIHRLGANQFKRLEAVFKSIEIESRSANAIIDILLMNVSFLGEKLKNEVFSIHECINQALSRYPFKSRQKELIDWDHKKMADFLVRGDCLLMIHVLFNLIKNALYYIAKSDKSNEEARIAIWLENGKDHNLLHFKDTGTGIPADILPHIFERFFSKTHRGAGIGLTFCQAVMESLGGSIHCESLLGSYTHFTLAFPIKKSNNQQLQG